MNLRLRLQNEFCMAKSRLADRADFGVEDVKRFLPEAAEDDLFDRRVAAQETLDLVDRDLGCAARRKSASQFCR